VNPQAEGATYPDVSFRVDPARVAAFREIFGMTQGVPATFLTAAEFSVLPSVVGDPRLALDFTRVLHGSQAYELHRPIVEGETLTVRARIDSVRVKGGTGFLTVVMDMLGADDEVAATATSVMLERAAS
jgi:hypothetical protein